MKHQLSKFHYGNRAIIFTLDVIVALTIFTVAIVISVYYASQASENKLAQIQMTTYASDLLAILDNKGALQTLDSAQINNQTESLLIPAYKMRILIKTENNVTVDIGGVAPEGQLTVTGARYFATSTDYGQARYWIWTKE